MLGVDFASNTLHPLTSTSYTQNYVLRHLNPAHRRVIGTRHARLIIYNGRVKSCIKTASCNDDNGCYYYYLYSPSQVVKLYELYEDAGWLQVINVRYEQDVHEKKRCKEEW